MEAQTPFSTIKFFKLFEAKLKAFNKYPLTLDNLNVQQDAFSRLGAEDDTTYDYDESFATFFTVQKERDINFAFSIHFLSDRVIFEIEYAGPLFVILDKTFRDEKDAADQLFAFCTMLCNGQIRFLHTTNNGYGCALEVLLQPTVTSEPIVISTQAKYPWWWSVERQGYEVEVKKNAYIKDFAKVPKNFFACDFDDEGHFVSNGRILKKKPITPLTKQKAAVLNYVQREMLFATDKNPEQPKQAWSHWEFWVVAALYSAAIGIGLFKHWFGFLQDYPIAFGIIGVTLAQVITARLILRKKQLQKEAPDHPYIKLDTFAKNIPYGWMTTRS